MTSHENALAQLAPCVRAFVQQHRIPADAVRAGGRVVLTIDRQYRVHVLPAPHQRVALQAELLPLPEHHDARTDELLLRLSQTASGLLQNHASTLSIDRARQSLVLQQLVEANADLASFQDALADFANALAFWRRLCRAEAPAAPQGRAA
jgi:hypothetical protein